MTENFISLINAGLDKTAGQYCRFLNKGQARLFEKMRYPEKPLRARAQTYKKPNPHVRSFLGFKPRPQWWSHCTALATKMTAGCCFQLFQRSLILVTKVDIFSLMFDSGIYWQNVNQEKP